MSLTKAYNDVVAAYAKAYNDWSAYLKVLSKILPDIKKWIAQLKDVALRLDTSIVKARVKIGVFDALLASLLKRRRDVLQKNKKALDNWRHIDKIVKDTLKGIDLMERHLKKYPSLLD